MALTFFMQMFVILATCRLVGMLAVRIGQPQVVGEMVAGVILGPSLLGLWFPDAMNQLFPAESMKVLYVGAQLGVGLYMFLVGAEFDTRGFAARAKSAFSISAAGMAAPFLLGALLVIPLGKLEGLFDEDATPLQKMFFLGAALSITAFPMLARIIYERGLTGSSLGTLALAAGAIGDLGAWCIMALVLASFESNSFIAGKAILGGSLYAAAMLTVGRRWLAPLAERVEKAGVLSQGMLALVLTLFMGNVWLAEALGVHAVFGGFLLGISLPRGLIGRELQRQLEPVGLVLLLPMFFTFSGLNTRLDMVDNLRLLGAALVVLLAACAGKGLACWAAARLHGEDNRTALALGALMNARGLMELILLNIGLQRGLIKPPLFSILVLMAVVTTLMASPVFQYVYGRHVKTGDGAEI